MSSSSQLSVRVEVHEEAMRLTCGAESLVSILTLPQQASAPESGVIIVVGGPQYRVGSHRQFVQLARRLAHEGHAVLRFDVRGMGDSGGNALPHFENIDADISAALAGLQMRLPNLRSVVLWGLCDGASASLMYVQRNPRAPVTGLCLVNPWVRSSASQAQTTIKHYYRDRIRQTEFWLKLFKGGVAVRATRDLLNNWLLARRAAANTKGSQAGSDGNNPSLAYQTRMAMGWRNFGGSILLLLSENDYTAKEFLEVATNDSAWQGALEDARVCIKHLAGTDHTCSDHVGRMLLEDATAQWLIASRASA